MPEVTLKNKRRYRLTETGEPYQGGEYPTGGILIHTWDNRANQGEGGWLYLNHSPSQEWVDFFLKAAERLPVLPYERDPN